MLSFHPQLTFRLTTTTRVNEIFLDHLVRPADKLAEHNNKRAQARSVKPIQTTTERNHRILW